MVDALPRVRRSTGNVGAATHPTISAMSHRLILLVLFDGYGSDLNKRMLVMVVFPMAFVTVPIAVMVVVPIFVIPIVVPAIFVCLDR
jgi:hypothetical protein